MGYILMLIIGVVLCVQAEAQIPHGSRTPSIITIENCYEWSRANYPVISQLDLIDQATQYSLANASRENLPGISLNGQATYQSEVTELPVALSDADIPTLSQDQYNVYGEIYQPLTDFSKTRLEKRRIEIDGQIQKQQVETDLYRLRDRINQIYFSVLLFDVKSEQLAFVQDDIDSTLSKLDAAIKNGTATLMDKQLLEVERISTLQQMDEIRSNKEAFLKMLSALTGKTIDETTTLSTPSRYESALIMNRPELDLFNLRQQLFDVQSLQISNGNIPSVGLFFQGGYGRPGLNFLSNEFSAYYTTGLKFNWNLSSFYRSKNERQKLKIQQSLIDKDRQTFLLNTDITQSQQSTEVDKYTRLLASDKQTVALREDIKRTAEIQLFNGLITTIDYIKIMNDENRAKQQLKMNEIMLLQAYYNLKTTTGN